MFLQPLARLLIEAIIPAARAHCDTADGPAVTDGRRALETGNLNFALKWIQADGEAELKHVFHKAVAVRKLGADAAEVADRLFLETLIRLHRMGEGVGFTGIQPSGAAVPPIVLAADRSLETGDDHEVIALAPADKREELHRRFQQAIARKSFDTDDVRAARDFVASYVSYFKFAEGEDHAHHHHAPAASAHAAHAQHGH